MKLKFASIGTLTKYFSIVFLKGKQMFKILLFKYNFSIILYFAISEMFPLFICSVMCNKI